jgi:hypothetical protein
VSGNTGWQFHELHLSGTSPDEIEKKLKFLLQKNQLLAYNTYLFWHALILPHQPC